MRCIPFLLLIACGGPSGAAPDPVEISETPTAPASDPVQVADAPCSYADAPQVPAPSLLDAYQVTRGEPDVASAQARLDGWSNGARNDPDVLFAVASAHGDLYAANGDVDHLREAIRLWATLIQNHANYAHIDDVLYQLGWSLVALDQPQRARQVFHRLIRNYPSSPHIEAAYLSFAEHYLRVGDARSAERFVLRVQQSMTGERPELQAYASYLQMWTHHQLDRNGDLSQLRVEVRDHMRELGTPGATRVLQAIENDWCYRP